MSSPHSDKISSADNGLDDRSRDMGGSAQVVVDGTRSSERGSADVIPAFVGVPCSPTRLSVEVNGPQCATASPAPLRREPSAEVVQQAITPSLDADKMFGLHKKSGAMALSTDTRCDEEPMPTVGASMVLPPPVLVGAGSGAAGIDRSANQSLQAGGGPVIEAGAVTFLSGVPPDEGSTARAVPTAATGASVDGGSSHSASLRSESALTEPVEFSEQTRATSDGTPTALSALPGPADDGVHKSSGLQTEGASSRGPRQQAQAYR
ncbi:hypothetical protein BD626DRAFT_568372 [Schizophyllum amplum]|uniref:Uncharacterized protein n=1 Tax=Schizophyllum amplum TaxID=97359 RepID=A0A550CIM3_9AGAR|nr:hypothetical protein BD626DRAFT_568372 [Auriculariopsis ampla]